MAHDPTAPPSEWLYALLSLGTPVRVKRGGYKGRVGEVVEALTPDSAPAYLTGAARYGIRFRETGGNVADFQRWELARLPGKVAGSEASHAAAQKRRRTRQKPVSVAAR